MEDTRRRRFLGGMTAVLAALAIAAMMWPGGGGPAPDGAQAFPGVTSIDQILEKAAHEEQAESRASLNTLHGPALDLATVPTARGSHPKAKGPKGSAGPRGTAGRKNAKGGKGEAGKKATASGKQARTRGAALSVAREFAQAFVVYEVGGEKEIFKAGFDATATDQLVKALLQRLPRQPADGKVPKAKVVNVVAGPSKGKVHQFSVSLLRVGVTSELKLEMEKGAGKKWQVTNVLG